DQRHSNRGIEKAEFLIQAMVAIHLAVIRGVNDDGILHQSQSLQRAIDLAHAAIHVSQIAEVAGTMLPQALLSQPLKYFDSVLDSLEILGYIPDRRQLGLVDGITLIPRPWRMQRRVRFQKAGDQEERFAFSIALQESYRFAGNERVELILGF